MPEDNTTQEALKDIQEINIHTKNSEDLLNAIESDLIDLNDHITTIEEFIVINNPDSEEKKEEEKKEDEQEDKKANEEKETKGDTGAEEEQEENITLEDVHEEIKQVNDNLSTTNNLLISDVFSNGVIAGVILFTLFWNRVMK